jgi:phage tail-like protein
MARREAFGAYYFSVEIKGIPCFFRSCSGLKSESEIQEVAEGGLNTTTHKLIGRTKFPNIVLKQGLGGPELFDLRSKFLKDTGGIERIATGTITQLGPGGQAVAKWGFEQGWVCKWEGPDFDASKNEISIETLEIAHEGLTKLM